MATVSMWTGDVQKALLQAYREGVRIPPPGAVDGTWGPRTQASLQAYFDTLPPMSVVPEANVKSASTVEISPGQVANGLYVLAGRYRAMSASRPEPVIPGLESETVESPAPRAPEELQIPAAAAPAPLVRVDSATVPTWLWWVVGLGGLGAIGGLVWYFKGRR